MPTSWQELHDEVQIDCILKGVVHLDDPMMVGLHQHIPLCSHMGHLYTPHKHTHVTHTSLTDYYSSTTQLAPEHCTFLHIYSYTLSVYGGNLQIYSKMEAQCFTQTIDLFHFYLHTYYIYYLYMIIHLLKHIVPTQPSQASGQRRTIFRICTAYLYFSNISKTNNIWADFT